MRTNSMILRNVAAKRKGLWTATCLELNIVVTASSLEHVKQELRTAIEVYFESVSDSVAEGLYPEIIPVRFYTIRKWLFEIIVAIQCWKNDHNGRTRDRQSLSPRLWSEKEPHGALG